MSVVTAATSQIVYGNIANSIAFLRDTHNFGSSVVKDVLLVHFEPHIGVFLYNMEYLKEHGHPTHNDIHPYKEIQNLSRCVQGRIVQYAANNAVCGNIYSVAVAYNRRAFYRAVETRILPKIENYFADASQIKIFVGDGA